MKPYTYLFITSLLIIAGCTSAPPKSNQEETAPSNEELSLKDDTSEISNNSEEKEIRETKNVIYQGIVKPAGISIYMEGSHRLLLPDGRFILLESDAVDLNGYVNERVELLGALRPTVEGAGTIMRVESARLLVDEKSNDKSDIPQEEQNEIGVNTGSGEMKETNDNQTKTDNENEINNTIESDNVVENTTPNPNEEEITNDVDNSIETKTEKGNTGTDLPAPSSPELTARIVKMSKEPLSAENWTQKYCTAHIGFCIPVHRNWWFKSFGTTSSYLWHVELSSEELNELYDGPIHINLISGTLGSKKTTDKQVRKQGSKIVGFRSWTDNRHFEISAPIALEGAVRYITENLIEYNAEN